MYNTVVRIEVFLPDVKVVSLIYHYNVRLD